MKTKASTISRNLAFVLFVFGWASLSLLGGCKHHPDVLDPNPDPTPTDTCDTSLVSFRSQIQPILNSYCAMSGCHDASTHEEGVNLSDYLSTINTGGVIAFDGAHSKLYEVLIKGGDDQMPQGGLSLTADQKALIKLWIDQGARDYYCSSASCDTGGMTYSKDIKAILNDRCTGCHSGSAPSGGIPLSSYSEVMTIVSSGQLAGCINHDPGYIAMPQGSGKLDDCTLAKIMSWIHNGAPQY